MAWKESGGGAEDPLNNEAEAETLLEDTVTSPEDVPDGLRTASNHEELEEQPLIDNDSPVKNKLSKTTPKLSKKEMSTSKSSSKSSPLITASRSNPKVPVIILDPSDRVSLNTGKTSVWICY